MRAWRSLCPCGRSTTPPAAIGDTSRMRRGLWMLALAGASVLAGCGPECEPDEGLGPNVSWGTAYTYAKTGDPVTLQMHVSARNITDGYIVHGHCEGEFDPMSGTVAIEPEGGAPVAGA